MNSSPAHTQSAVPAADSVSGTPDAPARTGYVPGPDTLRAETAFAGTNFANPAFANPAFADGGDGGFHAFIGGGGELLLAHDALQCVGCAASGRQTGAPRRNAAARELCMLRLSRRMDAPAVHFSFIRTVTVGSGFSPDLLTAPHGGRSRALPESGEYRRWGLSPRPENGRSVGGAPPSCQSSTDAGVERFPEFELFLYTVIDMSEYSIISWLQKLSTGGCCYGNYS